MKWLRILTITVFAWAFATGCGIPEEKYNADIAALKAAVEKVREELGRANTELAQARSEKEGLQSQLEGLNEELQKLQTERDKHAKELEQARKRQEEFKHMLERFRALIDSGKLKIKIVNNKMVVEMASAILFPSGRAKLSKEGKEALTQVAEVLATIEDRSFQVAGHTDNIPIKNSRFKSNWELSSARAVAVVKHLIENGVDPANLSGAGYGDTQPAGSNETEEGRAQNRRIEIILQPNLDELPDLSSLEKMID